MTTSSARFIRSFIAGLGLLFFVLPFAFRWYVSDGNRYAELLRKPAPWSYTGNLAYQLLGTIIAPAVLAIACLFVTLSLRDQAHFDHAPVTRRSLQYQLIAVVLTVFTIATLVVVFRTAPSSP